MEKFVVGFFQFFGSFLDHLLQTTGDFLLFLFALCYITTDIDKLGDLALLFPDWVDVDFEIARFTIGFLTCHHLSGMSLVADNLFQRTNERLLFTLQSTFLKDLIAFPSNHLFVGETHLF